MVLYIFSEFTKGSYVVTDDTGLLCSEFNYKELELLAVYTEVRGFNEDGIENAVAFRILQSKFVYEVSTWRTASLSHIMDMGYLLYGDMNIPLSSVLPKMMYGVPALVTDQGSLVYSYIEKDIRIRLSDFCRRIFRLALYNDTPIYVLDDKIEYIHPEMLTSSIASRWRFDTHNLTDKRLLEQFKKAQRNKHTRIV